MKFGLFVYCTVGRRRELEAGMAGKNPVLYRRMLEELADYARFAEARGYFGFGHPGTPPADRGLRALGRSLP